MDAGIIENCGKYSRVAGAGCTCLMWPCESVRSVVSLKVHIFACTLCAR